MNSFNEYNIINFMKTECEQRPQPETLQPTAKDNCKLQQPPLHSRAYLRNFSSVSCARKEVSNNCNRQQKNCKLQLLTSFLAHAASNGKRTVAGRLCCMHQPTANLFMHLVQYQTFNHTKEGIASCLFCNYLEALCLQPCHRSRLYTNNAQLMIRSAG